MQVARVEASLQAAGIELPEEVRLARELASRGASPEKRSPLTLPIPALQLNLRNREQNGRKKAYHPVSGITNLHLARVSTQYTKCVLRCVRPPICTSTV